MGLLLSFVKPIFVQGFSVKMIGYTCLKPRLNLVTINDQKINMYQTSINNDSCEIVGNISKDMHVKVCIQMKSE